MTLAAHIVFTRRGILLVSAVDHFSYQINWWMLISIFTLDIRLDRETMLGIGSVGVADPTIVGS